jgi:lipopolysaccharide transport system ATP-binding protein
MRAVEVDHLWKTFQIPHERRTTFFENLVGFMKPNQYETLTVLNDVSFDVDEGECIGIIGDNGSGKSTLLKIIAKILRPSKGTVRVRGKVTPFLELGVGFQPDLTALENIRLYATVMGLSNMEIKDIIDKVIEFSGLEKFRDTKLKNLSSGLQVRLAFSTAIQTDPDILLVDEVLAVGDMEFQQKCFDAFKRYKKEGVTILFVSHDLSAVRRFCDRTLLLGRGIKRDYGETSEILDRYVYQAKEDNADAKHAEPKGWGDKKVEITKVKFLNKFGREGNRFSCFDPMNIRIYYRAATMFRNPIFGIAFYSEEDQFLYGTNTELKNITIDHVEGEGYIDIMIEKIPMLYGRFLLTVAVHDHARQFCDWVDKQYSFEVLARGDAGGIFEVPCKWVV